MERIMETHHFGPHRVDVVEFFDDEGTSYRVLVDDVSMTDPPLPEHPEFDEVVRIYADWLGPARAE
jgi:hypothetical protein